MRIMSMDGQRYVGPVSTMTHAVVVIVIAIVIRTHANLSTHEI